MPNPYGEFVPDPLSPSGFRWKRHNEPPPTNMLPTVQRQPGRTVRYGDVEDHHLGDQVDVPPRVDDWCEDRSPRELSDLDEAE